MSEYRQEDVARLAKEWVDGVNSSSGVSGGWRLQFVRMRTRRRFRGADPGSGSGSGSGPSVLDVNGDPVSLGPVPSPEGRCDDLPVRIRRFVPGCPWALVDQAIRYLYRIAPYTGIVYNGVRLDGVYRPTRTEWYRDYQSGSPDSASSRDATYTLVQDLVEVTECDDELLVPSGSSCQQAEETTYVWDADSVEPLPVSCGGDAQGVAWSVRAVSRDEEGLYSYQLVKTVARTAAWGPVVLECGPLAETREWGWRNLYGDPVSGLYSRGCGEAAPGTPVELPPCDSAGGVRTQVQLTPNQDCTFDAVVRRRTSKPDSDRWTEGTACRPVEAFVYRNWRTPPEAPAAEGGARVSGERSRGEDGSWSATWRVAAPPRAWSDSWSMGSACRPQTAYAWRDQPERPAVPEPPPGGSVSASFSRTDDCLFDGQATVTGAPEPWRDSWRQGSACRPQDVEVWRNWPERPALPAPGPGETVSASLSRSDDCLYDAQATVSRAPSAAAFSWTDGSCAQETSHVAYSDVASVVDPGPGAPGEATSASWRRNDDCTYSGQVSTTRSSPGSAEWTEGSDCRPVRAVAAWGQDAVRVPAPRAGETVSASASRNADCTFDYTYRVRRPASAAPYSWTDGACGAESVHEAYSDVADVVDPGPGAPGEAVSASWQRNDDCTYTGRVTRTAVAPRSCSWSEGSCHATDVQAYFHQPECPRVSPGGVGVDVSASVTLHEDCTWSGVVRTRRSSPNEYSRSWESVDETPTHLIRYRMGLVVFSHVAEVPEPNVLGGSVSYSVQVNDDCTYSGQVSSRKLEGWTDRGGGSGGYGETSREYEQSRVVNGVRQTRHVEVVQGVWEGSMAPSASAVAHFDSVTGAGRYVIGTRTTYGRWT